jgi:hypothetical protein
MAANSKYICDVSQSLKVLDSLNDNNHTRYDYSVASKKVGYQNIISRMMIKEFIERNNITDIKESQFRYELGKIKKKMLSKNIDVVNLITLGRIQRNGEVNDKVYLFNDEVLMMVYDLVKARMIKLIIGKMMIKKYIKTNLIDDFQEKHFRDELKIMLKGNINLVDLSVLDSIETDREILPDKLIPTDSEIYEFVHPFNDVLTRVYDTLKAKKE